MISHPAADAARAAFAACRYEEASRILEHALRGEPTHPDLLCERGWFLAFSGQEFKAIELLPKARKGIRYPGLVDALLAHFLCARELNPESLEAQFALKVLAAYTTSRPEGIGTRLTACLIVKDEAANLPRCLASLKGIADEVVVIDTGSKDASVRIAAEAGAVIGHFEWCNDFSAARNASLELATGQWILWIDADEEVAPYSKAAIQRALVRPQFGGFDIEIVNLTEDRDDGDRLVHYPMRLFRNHPEIRFSGAIHEQIQPSVAALGMPWARLEGARIIHHGYRPQALADGKKLNRTRSMLEDAVTKDPSDAFQWFNLANAYLTEGRPADAEPAARRAISLMPNGSNWRSFTYQILAAALTKQGKFAETLAACESCEAEGDGGILNEFERTQALMGLGRFEEALVSADRSIEFAWPEGMTGDIGIATHKRFVLRAQILTVLGREADSLKDLAIALSVDPNYSPARLARAVAFERLGRLAEAAHDYELAVRDPAQFAFALKGLGRTRQELGLPGAADAFANAYEANPDDHEVWVQWVHALEQTNDTHGLLKAYEALAKRHTLDDDRLVDWGRALATSGEIERALSCFTEAIKRSPQNANAYFNAGDLLYRVGAYSEAAHVYEAGLRIAPEDPDAWFTLGNALAQMNLQDGAMVAYDQVLTLRPDHEGALYNRSVIAA